MIAHAARSACRCGRRPPRPSGSWPGRGGGQGADALHGDDGRASRAGRERLPVGRAARGACSRAPATWRRWRPSGTIEAQGRHREPRAARRGRAASSTPARAGEGEDTLDVFLQQIALVADADSAHRRRGPGDADDPAQRQGPGVPDRVHRRLRGRRVPALAGARRGRRWRRSAACSTSASRARCATCT